MLAIISAAGLAAAATAYWSRNQIVWGMESLAWKLIPGHAGKGNPYLEGDFAPVDERELDSELLVVDGRNEEFEAQPIERNKE